MDLEPEELQFLSFPSIFLTSVTILLTQNHRKLFAQIALSLILPLSLLYLIHIQISHSLFTQIHHDESALDSAPPNSASESRLINLLTSDWSLYLLFKAFYLLFLLIFSLLSTSAIVYVIASIFTAKTLTFDKVFSVLPKVWKRLMVTFLWAFLILSAYHIVSAMVIVAFLVLLGESTISIAIIVVLCFVYLAGLVWISVVWHVASVVSVLEDFKGIDAMKKSRLLLKGKSCLACGIFLLLNLVFLGIEFGFKKIVVQGKGFEIVGRIGIGLVMLLLLMVVILLGLVVQTVVYFVCKSYHHESIDKSSLSDHLEVYLGEYVPLKGRDVQMEHFSV